MMMNRKGRKGNGNERKSKGKIKETERECKGKERKRPRVAFSLSLIVDQILAKAGTGAILLPPEQDKDKDLVP
jgi:hypothetical protein